MLCQVLNFQIDDNIIYIYFVKKIKKKKNLLLNPKKDFKKSKKGEKNFLKLKENQIVPKE